MIILFIIYAVAGYWAAGQTIYANKVVVYSKFGWFFNQKLTFGLILGWILIPVALIKKLFFR